MGLTVQGLPREGKVVMCRVLDCGVSLDMSVGTFDLRVLLQDLQLQRIAKRIRFAEAHFGG